MNPEYKELTSKHHLKTLLNTDEIIVLDFYAPWCEQSKLQQLILQTMHARGSLEYTVYKCNTDKLADVARKYNITVVPSLAIILKDDKIKTFAGVQPACVIQEAVSNIKCGNSSTKD